MPCTNDLTRPVKTRLALAVVEVPPASTGVAFADLAPVRDTTLVPSVIATALALEKWPITEPSTATMIAIWIDIQNGPSSERT